MSGCGWGSGLISNTYSELITGINMLGMWRDDCPADPLNTVTNDIKNRKSIALEVHVHVHIPYSRKLSRDKTFAVFANKSSTAKVNSAKMQFLY